MTNYEKIKQMSVGELAVWLCNNLLCEKCHGKEHCGNGKNGLIEWLKQEVDDERN